MSYFEQTYGEILDIDNLYLIIQRYIINTNNFNFYDFGSGYGTLVINYRNKFKKCYGIEINKERHDIASSKNIQSNVFFINCNFFDITLLDNHVLFINNLCFGEGTQKRLSTKIINESKKGDLIIVTKKLKLLNKLYLTDYTLLFSWGESEIYLYKII